MYVYLGTQVEKIPFSDFSMETSCKKPSTAPIKWLYWCAVTTRNNLTTKIYKNSYKTFLISESVCKSCSILVNLNDEQFVLNMLC